MSAYRTARQVSCGGVIVRQHKGLPQVCLITRRQDGKRIWALPKGHIEDGEDPQVTALREVREETGLVGKSVASLGSISYWFAIKPEHVRYFKTVHFYLLRYVRGVCQDHDHEVERAVWLPLEEAMRRLSYVSERRILRKAKHYLQRHDRPMLNNRA